MDDPEELNDLFDDDLDNVVENIENEDEENGEVNVNLTNDEQNDNTQTANVVEIKKRVVRRPRVTLNADRLCGNRGIATLPKAFENVKFKGKGHEKEDLDKLMYTLKHWSYRLFPSMCFDDVLQNIERLGTKRPVQVCLRKMRLDMPVLNEDFVHDDDDDEDVNRDGDEMNSLNVPNASTNVLSEDAFDELLKENGQYMQLPLIHESELDVNNSVLSESEFPVKSPNTLSNRSIRSLTEEQKERIETNARMARERRMLLKSVQCDDYNREENDNNFESIPNLTDLNNQLIAYDKEPNSRSESETEVVLSNKEPEFYKHQYVDSEVVSCSKEQHLTKYSESELMFSSEDSNDDIKLNIVCNSLLDNNEQDCELAINKII